MVYMLLCVQLCVPMKMWRSQRRAQSVLLCHSLLCSLETGFGASLMIPSPQWVLSLALMVLMDIKLQLAFSFSVGLGVLNSGSAYLYSKRAHH